MAATVTVTDSWDIGGNYTAYLGTIALDNSYPTGGEAIDASGNERFDRLIATPGGTAATGAGRLFEWDAANQKLLAFYFDYDGVADGVAIQTPNTTDLSAVTALPFFAIGQ